MPPTIRIDNDVYAWLQQNARPFEDTPNNVLRRIAGLDTPSTDKTATESIKNGNEGMGSVRNRQLNGSTLNKKWNVGAKHALYHKDGTWYNNLERFPGALFDPSGYVLFNIEEEYENCRHLRIGQETNVPNGISRIPSYVRMNPS